MNLARRFKPERVKRVKSKLGKLNYKMTTEEKLFLKETWQKEGHKFSLDFYRELLFVIVREVPKSPEIYLKKTEELFNELKDNYPPKILEYNLLIQAHALSGKVDKCFELFEYVKGKQDIKPDQQTYLTMIRACAIADQKERGRPLFEELLQKELGPDVATYDEIYFSLKTF